MAEVEVNRRDMEAGESPALTSAALGLHYWPTIDGPLGVYHEEAVNLAKSFYYVGFLCLPWLWFINCLYFLPVLRNSRSDPLIRPYVVKSGIGFLVCGSLPLSWALTFAYGGEGLLGPSWKHLAVYDIANKYQQIFT